MPTLRYPLGFHVAVVDFISFQFGRASAPMIPQRVQTIPKVGTGTSSGQPIGARDRPVVSERTPFVRMLPRVRVRPAEIPIRPRCAPPSRVDRFHRWSRHNWTGGADSVVRPGLRGPLAEE
jgi:hypothetical protein